MSRTVVIAAALTVALVVPSAPAGAVAGYGDVPADSYFAAPVQWSVDNDVTDSAGTCFAPGEPVSRGETSLWLWNMEDRPRPAAGHSFNDITDVVQNDAVSWMAGTGITTGTSATTFSPDDTLTRAQAAAFLHRLAGEPEASSHSFTDVVADWQQDAVSWMASTGITTGTSATTFSPDDTLTRAQLVTFLYRYQNRPAVTVDPSTPECNAKLERAEVEMVALVNQLRREVGVGPLQYHREVAAVARAWSETMAAEDDFRHNPDFSSSYPSGWRSAAENISRIGRYYLYDTLSDAVCSSFDGLVDSPGHYANMVDPRFTHIGVGIAIDSGDFYLTQNFAGYPPGSLVQ